MMGQSRRYLLGLALIGATLAVAFIVYKYRNAVYQYNKLVHQHNNLVHEAHSLVHEKNNLIHEKNNLVHKYDNKVRDLEKTQKELIASKADVAKLIRHKFVKHSTVQTDALIITLRDYVYKNTVIGNSSVHFADGDAVDDFIKLDLRQQKMFCLGMAGAYSWLLGQFGIPSRIVLLFAKSINDSHASVEVFDEVKQRWYVSDPTFNVSFTCNGKGKLLDYEELFSCLRNGSRITAVRNGLTYLKGRTVEEHYIPYSELLYIIRAPEATSSDGRVLKEALALPYAE